MKKLVLVAISTLLLASCAVPCTNSVPDQYTDRKNWFCVETPELFRSNIQAQTTPTASVVTFHDDWYGFIQFEVTKIPSEDRVNVEQHLRQDPEALKNNIFDPWLAKIRPAFPGTEILHAETISENNEKMYFAFLKIPEGGTAADLNTGKRSDSLRGLLIFVSGDQIVVESYQASMILADFYKREDKSFVNDILKTLIENKNRYRNLTDINKEGLDPL